MTMFFDDEFDNLFKKMSSSFMNLDDIFEVARESGIHSSGPFYYGYTMTIGPDGILDIKFSTNDLGEENAVSLLNKFSEISPDYEFFRLADSFRILTEDLAGIREIFGAFGNAEDKFNTGLAKIKILIPPEQNRTDIASYVAQVLHSNGIEPVNAFYSQDNIIIVLNEKSLRKLTENYLTQKTPSILKSINYALRNFRI